MIRYLLSTLIPKKPFTPVQSPNMDPCQPALTKEEETLHGHAVVRAARALSPKPRFSYLDLCCLDARTLMLSLIPFGYYLCT
jgi:hypothetical protein